MAGSLVRRVLIGCGSWVHLQVDPTVIISLPTVLVPSTGSASLLLPGAPNIVSWVSWGLGCKHALRQRAENKRPGHFWEETWEMKSKSLNISSVTIL